MIQNLDNTMCPITTWQRSSKDRRCSYKT